MDVQREEQEFSEQEWLDLAANDREQAWSVLHRHFYKPIWSAVNQIAQNETLSEDVVQEAFIKAYRNFDRFKGDSKVSTWLYRIAMNQCYDSLRKSGRRRKWLGLFPLQDDEESQPHEAIDTNTGADRTAQADIGKAVARALTQLNPDQRAVVELRLIQGFSTEETARILKIRKGTVLSRLFYSCQKLKITLKGTYDEL